MTQIGVHHMLVVEDDPTQAQALERAAQMLAERWEVRRCDTGSQALDCIEAPGLSFDLAVVDLGLPDIGGLDVVRAWRRRFPNEPLLVISAIAAERTVLEAIRAGASGYLLKDGEPAAMAQGMRQVLEGHAPVSPALARYLFRLAGSPHPATEHAIRLTHKERQTLEHIGRGHSYAQTAELMGVSVSTIQTHVRNLYRKLGAHSQMQAVVKARESGLI